MRALLSRAAKPADRDLATGGHRFSFAVVSLHGWMLGAMATGSVGIRGRDFSSPKCDGGTFGNLTVAGGSMGSPDLLHVTVEPLEDARVVRATGEIDLSTV